MQPADPWYCSSCREPPPAKISVAKEVVSSSGITAPTAAAWMDRYNEMVQDGQQRQR